MIHLDANLLIAAVRSSDAHHSTASRVIAQPVYCGCSSVAWMEFHSKPVHPRDEAALRSILRGGILPFDEPAAVLAGRLYDQTGSKRRTRLDAMIAATAILAGAELATANPDDFASFVAHGLKLFSSSP
jgi:predicted nucleic acid-binding protein